MSSAEFFTLVREHLKLGGVMVVNMNMHSDKEGSINDYLGDTISSVFSEVYTVRVPHTTNKELFASNAPLMLTRLAENTNKLTDSDLQALMLRVSHDLEKYEAGGLILTDDKAPVELLGMQVIDDLISEELDYYKKVFKEQGIMGLLN